MNPLRARFDAVAGAAEHRDAAVAEFGFAIPTEEALACIQRWSPNGVVDLGAGVGYWAHLLTGRGVDVLAYDLDPPPSARNTWHAGRQPWHRVEQGAADRAAAHVERTLLIGWPTRNEVWPADAIEQYANHGGSILAYVGEPAGGHTGDDRFHAMLGGLETCMPCTYGVTNAPCICSVPRLWMLTEEVELPCWDGCSDQLCIYRRAEPSDLTGRRRWLRRR